MAITDHYISMSAEKAKGLFDTAPVDMTLLLGEECHVPTEQIHAVHIGGRESVNAYFRNHPDAAEREVIAIEEELPLPAHIHRRDYAWRVWIARKAREFGGVSILAHPHWIWFETYFMASSITQQLLKDGVYDALDITVKRRIQPSHCGPKCKCKVTASLSWVVPIPIIPTPTIPIVPHAVATPSFSLPTVARKTFSMLFAPDVA